MRSRQAALCFVVMLLGGPAGAGDAGADAALPELLAKIGEQLAPSGVMSCSFVERSTIEELDSDGKVEAREIHTFRVEKSGDQLKRTPLGVKKDLGELNSKLRPKPDSELSNDEKERRRRGFFTPFHAQEQHNYRFRWAQPPKNGRASISFEPLSPDVQKGVGVATVEVESGRLLAIVSKPSKFPVFLSEMDARTDFSNTACGLRQTRFELKGEGGILFVRMRFHFVTVLGDHQLMAP